MKAKVNTQVLNAQVFDSGALGLLAMVVHQFSTPGQYQAIIRKKGRPSVSVRFDVDEKSAEMQLNIDLADGDGSKEAQDCECKAKRVARRTVTPKGYVLFHASSGSGYSVSVTDSGGRGVFDSTRLDNGDLFAVSLLEPTTYSLSNTIDSAGGEIRVKPLERPAGSLKALDTQYVDVVEKRFEEAGISLTSAQGLVFRVKSPARIVIKQEGAEEQHGTKPAMHWQKLKRHQKQ